MGLFTQKQLERYADVLIWGMEKARSKRFKKGDLIRIAYDLSTIDLLEEVYKKLITRGFNVVTVALPNARMERDFFSISSNNQLKFIPPWLEVTARNLNGTILLWSPESLTHLADIDPKRQAMFQVERKFFRDIIFEREEQGLLGWTLCNYPSQAQADAAGLSIEEFTEQIVKACFLNRKDPVKHWEEVNDEQDRAKKILNRLKVQYFHIYSPSFELLIKRGENRQWLGGRGCNIPSFELFMSPDWREAEGTYYSDLPSYKGGNYVKGIKLYFREGSVTKVEAEEGEEFVQKTLKTDKFANKIGEFALVDKRFSNINKFMANTLYDENYGGLRGSMHIALGASYPDSYSGDEELTKELKEQLGFNDSVIHWDLINTEDKTVIAVLDDNKEVIIYNKGQFQL